MSDNQRSSSNRWIFRTALFVLVGLLMLARLGYGQSNSQAPQRAILQGQIHVQPLKPIPQDQTGKVQPGTSVKIVVAVENKGTRPSLSGELYVRYAFTKPLENEPTSVIFQTEKKNLPSIEPGKSIEIAFDTPHQWPSVLDFIRYDWPLREYQAVALFNQEEKIIGTLAVTFSAYYYPGIRKEFPTHIESEAEAPAK
ncbi:hypothetical protein [Candidatus Protochlamydia phocaeensis]|uniref:hypothetical protein n=1 Tax=Candidatus Protochlamydia phocaeensis TaxID=1414722 RepID=UPI00083814A6|nr:hypothetical protein [Candidatus Protochlamydia phocaeensis]